MSSKPASRVAAIKRQLMSPKDGSKVKDQVARSELEAYLVDSIAKHQLPQVVVYAENKDASYEFDFAVGATSTEDDARPIKKDDVFLLASQTKLVTTIAALQAVEKGQIGLDDDLAKYLPELAKQPILLGFDEDDDDKPILTERKNKITLRLLLTHATGCGYDAAHPLIMQWQLMHDVPLSRGATVPEAFDFPIVFEPGSGWNYGSAMDWAGLLVERLADSTLEDIFRAQIFDPLGIKEATFWPAKHPEMAGRIVKISERTDGGLLEPYDGQSPNDYTTTCFGGQGLYATMPEYIKIQRSILRDDGKLLKPASVKMMFTPQLTQPQEAALKDVIQGPQGIFFVGEYDLEIPLNWGLGGLMFMADDRGRRRKGTLQWSGMANTFWIIDPTAEVIITIGTAVMMPGDRLTAAAISAIERGVYKMFGVS